MRALITAGGRGTRLRPITNTINKHLVPVCNKPLLFQAIENVRAIGIEEVLININADDQELPVIVGNGAQFGVKISYLRQESPLGLGHVLKLAEPHLKGQPFVFYYGDNVLAGGLSKHRARFESLGANCHLCLVKVEDPSQFGVAVVEGDKVIRTVEKPAEFVSDLAITGIQFYDDSIFEAIRHVRPTPPKPPRTVAEMDIPPANQWLIDHGYKVTFSEITGWWKDTGRPRDLIAANRLLLDYVESQQLGDVDVASTLRGKVAIGEGATIINSVIEGPVVIGARAVIRDSRIGPNVSIGEDSEINSSQLADSIVLGEVRIHDINQPISDSIVGRGAVLTKNPEATEHRLIVGDQSHIQIP